MRSALTAAALLAAVVFGAPALAAAQDPETPPPPPPPQARERAVPRSEPIRARDPETRPASEGGAVRRESPPPRSDAPAPRPTASEERARTRSTPSAPVNASASDDDQGARPRGAVRRPPSGGSSGGSGGRTADRAIPRSEAPPAPRDPVRVFVYPDYYRYYNRYYDPWGYGGYGLGYFYYSPWAWDPGYYGGYGYYGRPRYSAYGYDLGRLKIKVKPQDAEVYVDGYFAGSVDDFDGIWQSLRLAEGGYRIEVRKPGFETLHFDVRVQAERTITFRGEMKPVP
jgi:hypothetical protein